MKFLKFGKDKEKSGNSLDDFLAAERRKKKLMKIGGGILAFIILILYWGLQPLRGTVQMGICRTFVELELPYPQTLKISEAEHPTVASDKNYTGRATEDNDRFWRIYYTYTGAFGEQRSDMIECKFALNPTGMPYLETVSINRVLLDQEKVELFNKTIPAIINGNPDLRLPYPPTDDLTTLKPPDDVDWGRR